jgi:hypothetical protein
MADDEDYTNPMEAIQKAMQQAVPMVAENLRQQLMDLAEKWDGDEPDDVLVRGMIAACRVSLDSIEAVGGKDVAPHPMLWGLAVKCFFSNSQIIEQIFQIQEYRED